MTFSDRLFAWWWDQDSWPEWLTVAWFLGMLPVLAVGHVVVAWRKR